MNEYDHYVSDYDEALCDGEPKRGFCQRLQLCFNDLGRLVYTIIDAKRCLVYRTFRRFNYVGPCATSHLKGPSIEASDEFSSYATRLLCRKPESPFALSFQVWNY